MSESDRHVVHIGYHKTASTWFQQSYYPNVGNARYVPRDTVAQALLEPDALHWSETRARETLGVFDGERRILCEENLSGYPHNGGLFGCLSRDMAERLHRTMPDAEIVIFIRNQPSMIAACYAQYIRGGGTHSANRYLWSRRFLHGAEADSFKIPRFSFEHFEYWPLVNRYVEFFGRDQVHLFAYEMFCNDPAGFLDGFGERLGLDADRTAIAVQRRRNVSYARPVLQLARFLNLFTRRTVQDKYYLVHIPLWYTVRRKLLETLNGMFGPGFCSSPERLLGRRNIEFIRDRYADTNRRLACEFELPLKSLGYPV